MSCRLAKKDSCPLSATAIGEVHAGSGIFLPIGLLLHGQWEAGEGGREQTDDWLRMVGKTSHSWIQWDEDELEWSVAFSSEARKIGVVKIYLEYGNEEKAPTQCQTITPARKQTS